MPFAYPDGELSYPGNFLSMMFKGTELRYKPNPVLEHALDVLFILHVDHEQTVPRLPCAALAVRIAIPSRLWPALPPRFTAHCMAARTKPYCEC